MTIFESMATESITVESTTVELLDGTVTLIELCRYTQLPRHDVAAMVEMGLLEPVDVPALNDDCRFASRDLRRAQIAQRLIRDLGVNLEGIAIIMDLIEQRDALLNRLVMLERLLER